MRLGNANFGNPRIKLVYLEMYIKHVSIRLIVSFWNNFVSHFVCFRGKIGENQKVRLDLTKSPLKVALSRNIHKTKVGMFCWFGRHGLSSYFETVSRRRILTLLDPNFVCVGAGALAQLARRGVPRGRDRRGRLVPGSPLELHVAERALDPQPQEVAQENRRDAARTPAGRWGAAAGRRRADAAQPTRVLDLLRLGRRRRRADQAVRVHRRRVAGAP